MRKVTHDVVDYTLMEYVQSILMTFSVILIVFMIYLLRKRRKRSRYSPMERAKGQVIIVWNLCIDYSFQVIFCICIGRFCWEIHLFSPWENFILRLLHFFIVSKIKERIFWRFSQWKNHKKIDQEKFCISRLAVFKLGLGSNFIPSLKSIEKLE